MKRKRMYRATAVKGVDLGCVTAGREGQGAVVGFDVGKRRLLAVVRWEDGRFERPWLAENPGEVPVLVGLLKRLSAGRRLRLAMEPTGTYGDALRQALWDAGMPLERVSGKAAHDYAEIFDGVPSQHDGKDAAVVAELAALGKSSRWQYEEPNQRDREMAYWVDWLDAHQRQLTMWLGRLEALLARHWPEATQWLSLSSGTLLRVLERYGGPGRLAEDEQAVQQLARWGGRYLAVEKVRGLVASAKRTVGVRQTAIDEHRMRQYAAQALAARREIARSYRELKRLAAGNEVIQRQARVVGLVTACVLWVHLGDPSSYHCAEAYRKAMGLNLKERSSGLYQGQLRISKRGNAQVRRWMYFAALRHIQRGPAAWWYQRKKSRDGGDGQRGVVAVMRKLALALYAVGARGEEFSAERLFGGVRCAPRRSRVRRSVCCR